ncbi:MAG: alpha/beta hydrolase [Chryseolinea sp.]
MLMSGCALRGVTRVKDLTFDKEHNLQLDVYASDKISTPKKVMIFVHGGRWKSGKKDQYKFLGRRFARKDIVFVIVDYRLSKKTDYRGMGMDVAKAVKWVSENVASYGGNNKEIFLSGHSAGGHLAALVSVDDRYFDTLKVKNPLKGSILIDAFGLDMYKFLSNESFTKNPVYYKVFGKDPLRWKDGSPVWHLSKSMPPSLIFIGGKTFPIIQEDGKEYAGKVRDYYKDTKLITCPKKSHFPMLFQFYNEENKAYSQILDFMDQYH